MKNIITISAVIIIVVIIDFFKINNNNNITLPNNPIIDDSINTQMQPTITVEDLSGGIWFEADSEGKILDGDEQVIIFEPDSTGVLWVTVGDGGSDPIYFTYEIHVGGVLSLTQFEDSNTILYAYHSKLPEEWETIKISLSAGQNTMILTIILSDDTIVKYASFTD